MRGTVAKQLRKAAYQDLSLRTPVKYMCKSLGYPVFVDPRHPRSRYLKLKRAYKLGLIHA